MMALSLALSALTVLPAAESALPITKPAVQSPVAGLLQIKNASTVLGSTPFELHNTCSRQLGLVERVRRPT